jgi:hypothetical protein
MSEITHLHQARRERYIHPKTSTQTFTNAQCVRLYIGCHFSWSHASRGGGVTEMKFRTVRMCFIVLNLSGSSQQRRGRGREECTSFPLFLAYLLCLQLLATAPRDREGAIVIIHSLPPTFSILSLPKPGKSQPKLLLYRATLHYYYCGWHGNARNACKVVF